MDVNTFLEIRQKVINAGYGDEIVWQESLKPCNNAWEFFAQYMWVVLSSGMKNQVARLIEARILKAWQEGKPTASAFKHEGKVKAIDDVRQRRIVCYAIWSGTEDKLTYLDTLPYIGGITKYHLAKNLGMDIVKPDRHLVRIAENEGTNSLALCEQLAKETGYRKATVDIILWRACNLGII